MTPAPSDFPLNRGWAKEQRRRERAGVEFLREWTLWGIRPELVDRVHQAFRSWPGELVKIQVNSHAGLARIGKRVLAVRQGREGLAKAVMQALGRVGLRLKQEHGVCPATSPVYGTRMPDFHPRDPLGGDTHWLSRTVEPIG